MLIWEIFLGKADYNVSGYNYLKWLSIVSKGLSFEAFRQNKISNSAILKDQCISNIANRQLNNLRIIPSHGHEK